MCIVLYLVHTTIALTQRYIPSSRCVVLVCQLEENLTCYFQEPRWLYLVTHCLQFMKYMYKHCSNNHSQLSSYVMRMLHY
jgi:hypothetical protein